MRLVVGVCKETAVGEHRVAIVPESVGPISALGAHVAVQSGAGAAAGFTDDLYAVAGAAVLTRAEVIGRADLLVGIGSPGRGADDTLRSGQAVVGLLRPLRHPLTMRYLADHGIIAISLDLMPHTRSEDEEVDAAASQAAVAGQEAVLLSAARGDRRLAGKGPGGRAVRILVIGTGTAARQAVATARGLGAAVEAHDPGTPAAGRPTIAGLQHQATPTADPGPAVRLALARIVPRFDVVVVTGRQPATAAPEVLVTAETVAAMRPGSVIVDTTAEPGGSTVETAQVDSSVTVPPGVTVIGAGDLPSRFANTASTAYSRRVAALLPRFVQAGSLAFDLSDPLVAAIVVTYHRSVLNDAVLRQILDATAVAGLP